MLRKGLYVLMAVLVSTAVNAHQMVEKPVVADKYIHAINPYGEGSYSWMFFKVYEIALWTDAEEWSMHTPFALSMKYDLSADSDEITDRIIDQLEHPGVLSKETLQRYREMLAPIFPSVKTGDTITAIYVPKGTKTILYHNDKPIGTITDPAFARAFFGIWLAPTTSGPQLRTALLRNNQ